MPISLIVQKLVKYTENFFLLFLLFCIILNACVIYNQHMYTAFSAKTDLTEVDRNINYNYLLIHERKRDLSAYFRNLYIARKREYIGIWKKLIYFDLYMVWGEEILTWFLAREL